MINIKKFIDKVAYLESRNNKDVLIPLQDARGLRDEISKLLLDLTSLQNLQKNTVKEDATKIEIKGGTFK